MTRVQPGKPKIVAVWWDAHGTFGNAYAEHEIPHGPMLVMTMGWLLKEDDAGLTLANEYCGDGTWRGVTFVPRNMIKEVQRPRPRKSRVVAPQG